MISIVRLQPGAFSQTNELGACSHAECYEYCISFKTDCSCHKINGKFSFQMHSCYVHIHLLCHIVFFSIIFFLFPGNSIGFSLQLNSWFLNYRDSYFWLWFLNDTIEKCMQKHDKTIFTKFNCERTHFKNISKLNRNWVQLVDDDSANHGNFPFTTSNYQYNDLEKCG